jgi:hypothetical protein
MRYGSTPFHAAFEVLLCEVPAGLCFALGLIETLHILLPHLPQQDGATFGLLNTLRTLRSTRATTKLPCRNAVSSNSSTLHHFNSFVGYLLSPARVLNTVSL